MTHEEWWFVKDGNKNGPISVEEIERKLICDELTPETMVWSEGMVAWKRMSEVQALAASLKKMPPPIGDEDTKTTRDSESTGYLNSDFRHRTEKQIKKSNNFFVRYWRGEVSLPVSYWLVNITLTIAAYAFVAVVMSFMQSSKATNPIPIFFTYTGVMLSLAIATVWQLVGIWRSAGDYIVQNPKKRWGQVARAMTVLGGISGALQFAEVVPTITELSRVAFQNDPDLPDYKLTVTQDGKELKFSGGLKFGVTEDVQKILSVTPSITTIDLDSIGGRIAEAEKLYDLIVQKNLNTVTNSKCVSACTFVFAAGAKRWLGFEAKLGFHSASFPGLTDAEARDQTKNILRRIQEKDDIPRAFLEKAYAVSAKSVWYPDRRQLFQNNFLTSTRLEALSSMEEIFSSLRPELERQKKELPKRIDEVTTHTGLKTDGSTILYVYSLEPASAAAFRNDAAKKQEFKRQVKSDVCRAYAKFINGGLTYAYVYFDLPDKEPLIYVRIDECP